MYLTYSIKDSIPTFEGSWSETSFEQNALVGIVNITTKINEEAIIALILTLKDTLSQTYTITSQNTISEGVQLLLFELDTTQKTGKVRTYTQPTTWQ